MPESKSNCFKWKFIQNMNQTSKVIINVNYGAKCNLLKYHVLSDIKLTH